MRQSGFFSDLNSRFDALRTCKEEADALEAHLEPEQEIRARRYLKQLRRCDALANQLEAAFNRAVSDAILADNFERFSALVKIGLPSGDSFRSQVAAYYETRRASQKIASLETLRSELEEEETSRTLQAEEYAAYEAYVEVLAREEAERLQRNNAPDKRRNVLITTEAREGGYDFVARNLNPFRVTVALTLKALKNFQSDTKNPLYVELPPKSEQHLLHVSRINPEASGNFQSHYSWVMGSALAKHSNPFYRLPFPAGSTVPVSQGFFGTASHRNKHAIDFAVKTGTPIVAARAGRVIAVEDSHDRGKFDKSFARYANYIIIEHDDRTLGNYYHLKYHGVAVKVGQNVTEGELIGYTGNTGYSSGPHLHFSVSMVDPVTRMKPVTVSFRIKNGSIIISNPRKGDVFTVQ